ncbi:MAG: response regulator transcription factor [Deltaproteobacteria bacterium]|nr:response regulator transcription factor [Deltaproteobacteria bacterium]
MAERSKPITILLADDHPVVRQGLRALLEAQSDLQVIGETGDGLEGLHLVNQLKPDILVADISMPGLNGLDVTKQVTQFSSHTRVIILSMHSTEAFVAEALKNGAAAYVLKDSTPTDLVRAVYEVAAGKRFLSPKVAQPAIDLYVETSRQRPGALHANLTDREREVFQLVVEGHNNAQIATRLFISPRTVEIHRRTMMQKLGVKTQLELLAYAVKRGLISVDEPLDDQPKKNSQS